MNYEQFHGLAIIHPDYLSHPKNPRYSENLRFALDVFYTAGKPIFVARDVIMQPNSKVWEELKRVGAREIPIDNPSEGVFPSVEEFLRQNQREVDFIVSAIGISGEEIRLAFGGLNAEECVYAFATAYCREVETNYPGREAEPLVEKPLKLGKVFDEIV